MSQQVKLSKYFYESETTQSQLADRLGIRNIPTPEIHRIIQTTAYRMDIVREAIGAAILVSSWYRCIELNDAIGSKRTSQHIKGEAVDFTAPHFGSPLDIAKRILSQILLIQFDQLIYEYSWVHISFQSNPQLKPRGSVLTLATDGKSYLSGLVEKQ